MARAEVKVSVFSAPIEPAQGAKVSVSQIRDVHIVADGRPVGRRVVIAVNRRNFVRLQQRPKQGRDQVGFRLMPFANLTTRVSPGGVEVPQGHPAEALSFPEPAQELLYDAL